jgi:acyl-CoA thioester hydrolase
MKACHEALTGFPVVIALPVLWGDQDPFGHVNNVVYLRWCETARVEYLIRAGFWPRLPPETVGPILAAVSCDYKRPVTHPDTVYVGARVTRIGNRSFRMEHRIVSKSLDMLVAQSDTTLVALDYSRNKTVPVPEECRKAMEKMEGRVLESAPAAPIDP